MGVKYKTDMLYENTIRGAEVRKRVNGILVMSENKKTEEHIKVDREKCTGCKLCYDLCPTGSYEMTEGKADWATFGMDYCGECGLCRYICPVGAIEWNYPEGGTGKIHQWA